MRRLIVPLFIVYLAGAAAFFYVHRTPDQHQVIKTTPQAAARPRQLIKIYLGSNGGVMPTTDESRSDFIKSLADYCQRLQDAGFEVIRPSESEIDAAFPLPKSSPPKRFIFEGDSIPASGANVNDQNYRKNSFWVSNSDKLFSAGSKPLRSGLWRSQ